MARLDKHGGQCVGRVSVIVIRRKEVRPVNAITTMSAPSSLRSRG
jgi:hypothetical protein